MMVVVAAAAVVVVVVVMMMVMIMMVVVMKRTMMVMIMVLFLFCFHHVAVPGRPWAWCSCRRTLLMLWRMWLTWWTKYGTMLETLQQMWVTENIAVIFSQYSGHLSLFNKLTAIKDKISSVILQYHLWCIFSHFRLTGMPKEVPLHHYMGQQVCRSQLGSKVHMYLPIFCKSIQEFFEGLIAIRLI